MKNYTKFTAIFLVLAVLLSIPVFAEESWKNIVLSTDEMNTTAMYYPGENTALQYDLEVSSQTSSSTTWIVPAISEYNSRIYFFTDFPVSFNVSDGDIVFIDSFLLKWYIGGANNFIYRYRVCMGDFAVQPEYFTQWYNAPYSSGNSTLSVQVPDITIDITSDVTIGSFFIEFQMYHPIEGSFSLYNFSTRVGYGNPSSPEAPGYTKPDGGAIDDYHDLEQGVLNDTESGMNAANSIFGGFVDNIFGFVSGLLFVSELMGLFIVKVPVVGLLIQISLALGLFAVLVGLSGSIIGAKERHDRNIERSRKK